MTDCAEDREETDATALQWTEAEAEALKTAAFDELSMAMSEVTLGSQHSPAPVVVDADPYLCGLWGHGCECTLSHQAVREGVPAFQLETPYTLRCVQSVVQKSSSGTKQNIRHSGIRHPASGIRHPSSVIRLPDFHI